MYIALHPLHLSLDNAEALGAEVSTLLRGVDASALQVPPCPDTSEETSL